MSDAISLPAAATPRFKGTYERLQSRSAIEAYFYALDARHGFDGARWIAERVEEIDLMLTTARKRT